MCCRRIWTHFKVKLRRLVNFLTEITKTCLEPHNCLRKVYSLRCATWCDLPRTRLSRLKLRGSSGCNFIPRSWHREVARACKVGGAEAAVRLRLLTEGSLKLCLARPVQYGSHTPPRLLSESRDRAARRTRCTHFEQAQRHPAVQRVALRCAPALLTLLQHCMD